LISALNGKLNSHSENITSLVSKLCDQSANFLDCYAISEVQEDTLGQKK